MTQFKVGDRVREPADLNVLDDPFLEFLSELTDTPFAKLDPRGRLASVVFVGDDDRGPVVRVSYDEEAYEGERSAEASGWPYNPDELILCDADGEPVKESEAVNA